MRMQRSGGPLPILDLHADTRAPSDIEQRQRALLVERLKAQQPEAARGNAAAKGPEGDSDRTVVALMHGLDTNVLVRFLVRDDEAQFKKADRWLDQQGAQGEVAIVSLLVLFETEWVLRSRYAYVKADIVDAVSALLDSSVIAVERQACVEEALFTWKDSHAEFADCLIGAYHRLAGCDATVTFDAKAAELPSFARL